jgi:predicted CopG family antitoxin
LVCVPDDTMDKLAALRRPGESFSDVIIRLAGLEIG